MDDIFKCIFLNEKFWIPTKISPKFVPKGLINNILALVQVMAWRRPGDKPLSEPMMVSSPTHICVTRSQSINPIETIVSWSPFGYEAPLALIYSMHFYKYPGMAVPVLLKYRSRCKRIKLKNSHISLNKST